MKARKPTATIFAGVNGAGKTTLYFKAQEQKDLIDMGYRINVDEIAQSIGDPRDRKDQLRASKIAINMRNMYLKNKLSFNQETTLCGSSIMNLFYELKKLDFKIVLYYVRLDSPETAKERVRIRVSKGGHNIEPHLIDKRYYESLANFKKVIPLCDEVYIYDNTSNFKLVDELKSF
ncbi:AAA family ATPase [Helicobacter sp. 11S02629-2]|uniref:zeta toxin family protein n=1 Tax=Helicobacter sp. 11S02629-2 TaxID=1476195 RepID=UPI000BA68B49|nr:AAA family ATPase [Helicobacter sp. 11S02629-2]PAF41090.1 ATPase [Helicobacter sp. 11S02629-2]